PGDVRHDVYSRAEEIHRGILSRIRNQPEPTLFSEDDPLIDEIVDAANTPRCPLLGENGECRIYDHRPLACRLEGVPTVNTQRRLFGDWCELNFKEGVREPALTDSSWIMPRSMQRRRPLPPRLLPLSASRIRVP